MKSTSSIDLYMISIIFLHLDLTQMDVPIRHISFILQVEWKTNGHMNLREYLRLLPFDRSYQISYIRNDLFVSKGISNTTLER